MVGPAASSSLRAPTLRPPRLMASTSPKIASTSRGWRASTSRYSSIASAHSAPFMYVLASESLGVTAPGSSAAARRQSRSAAAVRPSMRLNWARRSKSSTDRCPALSASSRMSRACSTLPSAARVRAASSAEPAPSFCAAVGGMVAPATTSQVNSPAQHTRAPMVSGFRMLGGPAHRTWRPAASCLRPGRLGPRPPCREWQPPRTFRPHPKDAPRP